MSGVSPEITLDGKGGPTRSREEPEVYSLSLSGDVWNADEANEMYFLAFPRIETMADEPQ
jgi:hypothetical protein